MSIPVIITAEPANPLEVWLLVAAAVQAGGSILAIWWAGRTARVPLEAARRDRIEEHNRLIDSIDDAADAAVMGLRQYFAAADHRNGERIIDLITEYDGVDRRALDDYVSMPAPNWPSHEAFAAATRLGRRLNSYEGAMRNIHAIGPMVFWSEEDRARLTLYSDLEILKATLARVRRKI